MRLDLKNDVIFKTFFSKKGNEKFLKDFLENLLQIRIQDIHIMQDVSLERLSLEEKLGILDIQAILDNQTIISIEMQLRNENNITRRNGFYAAKELSSEVRKKEKYSEFKPVIMINILGFSMTDYQEYVSKGITVLQEHREYELDTGITYYFIELPKFRKSKPNLEKGLNQWLAFIDNEEGGLVKMAQEKNKVIEEAAKELEYLTGDEEVKRMAFLHEKWERDYESGIADAREEGRQAGLKKGKEEGMQAGLKKGKEEGKYQEKVSIAKKLKQEGLPLEQIAKITELAIEKIEQL